ncbi:MAG: transposase [Thiohalocapsa sp.]|nr:transposase [Thiohalocapsa sp.]
MLVRNTHRPAHLFLNNTPYFLTGSIHRRRPLLDADLKESLIDIAKTCFGAAGWRLQHWVVLDEHYHLIAESARGADLPDVLRGVHGRSARVIRKRTRCDTPVWYNYWDYCPRNDRDYYNHVNYLLNNPIKHGYVEDLHDWPFSSFHELVTTMGRDRLARQFREYPSFNSLDIADDFGSESSRSTAPRTDRRPG